MSIDFGTDIYEEPLVSKSFLPEDSGELSLRPHTLREYIGQQKAKENLSIFIEAARRRTEPLDHVLLHGPPGLGKTTLAGIIAAEMGVNIRITSGPAIEKPGDLAALLTNLSENDILFVDESHRLNRSVEEILYPAMEDYAIDIIIGKGPSANSIRLDLPKFTLIGATTRAGQLSAPLRDRFGVLLKLELYSPDELSRIIQRSAGILDQPITPEGAYELAKCSRGTPRVANRFLKRIRDFATVLGDGVIDRDVSLMGLKRMDVDALGLDELDRSLLRAISKAIMASDVGINPIDDGQTIRLNFPAPNEERRKQLAKEVSKLGEEAKVAVRNVRREAMDKAKAMKKTGELTEDTQKTMEEDVQKLTDKYIKNIDAAVEEKQKEIMSV